jgi:integrase/recombinase XerD
MVSIEKIFHRGKSCLAIRGRYPSALYDRIRTLRGVLYSKTHECFYVEEKEYASGELLAELEGANVAVPLAGNRVDPNTATLPEGYEEKLRRMRYSDSTRINYCSQFLLFLKFLLPRKANDIVRADVENYVLHLVKNKWSSSKQNQAINAIKFYLEKVREGAREVYYNERPRKEKSLPRVLGADEVFKMIDATTNLKHRCILVMLYATGIRLSELLNLKLTDLNASRKVVQVISGKGNKDRITLFSETANELVNSYIGLYKPKVWLFEGPGGVQYSARSVDRVVKHAAKRAGIGRNVSPHMLRHSFATHLLESGVDLRYIQALLGHDSIRTTEIYAHVTTSAISKIVSPFDRLEGNKKATGK